MYCIKLSYYTKLVARIIQRNVVSFEVFVFITSYIAMPRQSNKSRVSGIIILHIELPLEVTYLFPYVHKVRYYGTTFNTYVSMEYLSPMSPIEV